MAAIPPTCRISLGKYAQNPSTNNTALINMDGTNALVAVDITSPMISSISMVRNAVCTSICACPVATLYTPKYRNETAMTARST